MESPRTIKFGSWEPDAATRESPLTEAKGCVATAGSYAPLRSPVQIESSGTPAALTGTCLGAAGFFQGTNVFTFAGDASKLYRLVNNAVEDVSKMGGYALSGDETWQFAQFGDFVVAVAGGENPQVYEIGVSSDFADLGGSPPQFTCVGRINDFLMGGLGNTVTWSAFNNITDWTPDPGTQSDSQELDQAGGNVMAIVGGLVSAVFQERQIRRVLYVGGSVIFDFGQDAAEKRRGALSRNGVLPLGRFIFYVSEEGFYIWDGQQSLPIGENRVDRYFLNRLNYGARHRICAAYDSVNKAVHFGYPSGSSTDITEQLIYSLTDQKWTNDDIRADFLTELPQSGFTLETLDDFFGTDDLDSWDQTLDDPAFSESRRLLAGIDTSHAFVTFTGQNRPVTLDTIEAEIAPGRHSLVTELWPMVDVTNVANVTGRILHRTRPGGTLQLGTERAMNSQGFCPMLADDRFLRARIRIAEGATWTRAEGVHFTAEETGER